MINKIMNLFSDNPDLIINHINNKYTVIYFESICSSDRINEFITKPIINNKSISGPHKIKIDINLVDKYLNNSYAIVIENNSLLYAVEVKADLSRSIDTPESQPSINGPKDSFTENIQTNLGLIKRRIKTNKLKVDTLNIGKYTDTLVEIIYINEIVSKKDVLNIKNKIKKISVSNVIDSSNLSNSLAQQMKSDFPIIISTERPDEVSNAICEGKIIILVDNSPFVLITPAYFTDFINPVVDRYAKPLQTNFIKFIRYLCLIITILEPAYYIATINYNQETIPTSLLINFMIQKGGVPFPSVAEALIMLLIYEILKESDARFPSKYGSTISILGALILGEAAVAAGIVSPIMIITIALSFISSLAFNNTDFNNAIRIYRFLFLICAAILGLYGILLGILFMIIRLCSTYSNNKPYTIPISPFKKKYFFNYIWRKAKK